MSDKITPTGQSDQTKSDSWENRIEQASIYLGLEPSKTESILSEFGISKEPAGLEMLSDEEVTLFGDLRKIFCEDNGVAVPKLRMALKFLRGPKNSPTTEALDPMLLKLKQDHGIKVRLEDLSADQLLQYYDPSKPNSRVNKVLKDQFGDKPVIAFKPNSKEVAVEETANYMTDIEQGYPEEKSIEVDGLQVRLHAINRVPDEMIDEDPLFPHTPLKRDRSAVNRANWSGVPRDTRQFVRIIVERNEVNVQDRFAVKTLIDAALEGIDALRETFPEADLEYRERKQKDDLPKLRMTLDEVTAVKQNPFAVGNRRR